MDQETTNNTATGDTLKFLAGVASILTLIAAVLSALGFVILRSHASLLGLSSFLHHALTDYLYEGGAFVAYTFLSGLAAVMSVSRFWWIAGLLLLTLYVVHPGIKPLANRRERLVKKYKLTELTQKDLFQWICLVATLWLVYCCMSKLAPASNPDNLLFADSVNVEVVNRASLEGLKQLELHYESRLKYFLLSVVAIALFSWIPFRPSRKGVELLLTVGKKLLYVLLLVETLLLAVSYSVYVYPNEFHKVCLQIDEKATAGIVLSDNAWLIREDADGMIVYFGDTKQIHKVKKDNIVNVAITERKNVLGKPDPSYDQTRCFKP